MDRIKIRDTIDVQSFSSFPGLNEVVLLLLLVPSLLLPLLLPAEGRRRGLGLGLAALLRHGHGGLELALALALRTCARHVTRSRCFVMSFQGGGRVKYVTEEMEVKWHEAGLTAWMDRIMCDITL